MPNLTSHKNGSIVIIHDEGFQAQDFRPAEDASTFSLTFRDSPFQFSIKPDRGGFRVIRTMFSPNYLKTTVNYSGIDSVYNAFRNWLAEDLSDYIGELQAPDLWAQMSREAPVVTEEMFEDDERKDFTNEEKKQIKVSITQFRLLINQNFHPTDDQLVVIDERLQYLSESVDRLNRFDWRSVLMSSIITIASALTLNTEQGKSLWSLAKQAFTHIVSLNP